VKAFLDTSSVLKLYHKEEGSEELENYLEDNIEEIVLSELAILEFRSAIWRKVRMNEIEDEVAKEVMSYFEEDYKSFTWLKLHNNIVKSASELLMKYGTKGLRTLDSIQLASALTLKYSECVFLTSDNLLKSLFLEEELELIKL
jgi:predicted nucleic acid-binding protein